MENDSKPKGKIRLPEDDFIALCFLVMTVLLTLGILSRVLANFSFAFMEELVVQLYLLTTMYGISGCVIKKSHMGLSIIVDAMPCKLRKVFIILVFAISCAFFAFIGYQGFMLVMSQYKYGTTTPVLQIPQWIFTTCFPIGSALFIFRSAQQLVIDLKEAK